jgi:hypothetical protein
MVEGDREGENASAPIEREDAANSFTASLATEFV